jgi:hypothetical protein
VYPFVFGKFRSGTSARRWAIIIEVPLGEHRGNLKKATLASFYILHNSSFITILFLNSIRTLKLIKNQIYKMGPDIFVTKISAEYLVQKAITLS